MTIKFRDKILSFEKRKPMDDDLSLVTMDIEAILNRNVSGEVKVYDANTMKYERSITVGFSRDDTSAWHEKFVYKTSQKEQKQKFDIYIIGDNEYNHYLDSLVIIGEHSKSITSLRGLVSNPYGFGELHGESGIKQSKLKDSIIYIPIRDSGIGALTKVVGYDVENNRIVLISGYTFGNSEQNIEVMTNDGKIAFECLETNVINHEKYIEFNEFMKELTGKMTEQERSELTVDKLLKRSDFRNYFHLVTILLDLK